MDKKLTWLGSRTCDICHQPIADTLYDAMTIHGPWATMCHSCFCEHSIMLGIGFGQRYVMQDGSFTKAEG